MVDIPFCIEGISVVLIEIDAAIDRWDYIPDVVGQYAIWSGNRNPKGKYLYNTIYNDGSTATGCLIYHVDQDATTVLKEMHEAFIYLGLSMDRADAGDDILRVIYSDVVEGEANE
ncbi:MAG: hypothetical protein VR70_06905 [Rhodospirillaceae bacterium BRH_c57]|nr:MAG: hypothetical protein VR70_06905 [Rhodospirillaceae bacterium BRH_c57]